MWTLLYSYKFIFIQASRIIAALWFSKFTCSSQNPMPQVFQSDPVTMNVEDFSLFVSACECTLHCYTISRVNNIHLMDYEEHDNAHASFWTKQAQQIFPQRFFASLALAPQLHLCLFFSSFSSYHGRLEISSCSLSLFCCYCCCCCYWSVHEYLPIHSFFSWVDS